MAETRTKKQRPPEIEAAMAVLDELRVRNDGRYEDLKKQLPTIAIQLKQAGEAVTKELLRSHIEQGPDHLDALKEQFSQSARANKHKTYAEIVAKLNGEAAAREKEPTKKKPSDLVGAAQYGHLDVVKYLVEQGANIHADNDYALRGAAGHGHLDVVKYLVEQGANIHASSDCTLFYAAHNGHLDVVKYLVEQGADIHVVNDRALYSAAGKGHLDVVKYLVGQETIIHVVLKRIANSIFGTYYAKSLRGAAQYGHFDVVKYLVEQGADISVVEENKRRSWDVPFRNIDLWQERHKDALPPGLAGYNPYYFHPQLFESVSAMLAQEGYEGKELNCYSYGISGLLGSEDRVLRYLEKWRKPGKQPLHDLVHMISLPLSGRPDLKAWGDAALKFGPDMAKLVKFSDRLEKPAASLNKTREIIAEFAYERGAEHKALATLCHQYEVDEDDFEEALELVLKQERKTGKKGAQPDHIPDITIDGAQFDMPEAIFMKLPANDIRGLFLGEITDCCQSIGGVGSDCAEHGYKSENSGFYVVMKDRKIIGQCWAWRGKKGELVFDSLETLGDHISDRNWEKICAAFGKKIREQDNNVTAFYVGKGGGTPSMAFNQAANAAKPKSYDGYRDSKQQYQVWQHGPQL